MFAKSQTDWPFGWSAKQAKRSNHDPAWKVKGNHGPSTTWLAANHSHPFPFPGPIARLGSFYAFTFHPIAAMVGFYLSTSPVFMLTGSAWKKKQPTLWTLGCQEKCHLDLWNLPRQCFCVILVTVMRWWSLWVGAPQAADTQPCPRLSPTASTSSYDAAADPAVTLRATADSLSTPWWSHFHRYSVATC